MVVTLPQLVLPLTESGAVVVTATVVLVLLRARMHARTVYMEWQCTILFCSLNGLNYSRSRRPDGLDVLPRSVADVLHGSVGAVLDLEVQVLLEQELHFLGGASQVDGPLKQPPSSLDVTCNGARYIKRTRTV